MNDLFHNGSNLKQLLDVMQEVVVLCFYKGFPITSNAIFQSIHGDRIVFKVSPPGSICLQSVKNAWILGGEFFDALKVSVVSFDVVSGSLEVSEPTYAGIKFGNRKVARVEPHEVIPVSVTLDESGEKAQGRIVDISLGGAGILLDPGQSLTISPGESVTMEMKFPEESGGQSVKIVGKIIGRSRFSAPQPNAGGASHGQGRFSTSFSASMLAKTPIMSYIAHRRAQLMREINQLYQSEMQKKVPPQN